MDNDAGVGVGGTGSGGTPESPSLSGIESKKHRMHTGQDSEGFARYIKFRDIAVTLCGVS